MPLGERYRVFEPAMTVDPGEAIVVETINHMSPVVRGGNDLHAHGSSGYREREETGPIFVRGALPGSMLAIRIEHIELVGLPHAHGSGPLADLYPQQPLIFCPESGRCRLPGGVSVPTSPMVGDIYTTPAAPDPAGADHGGNMDFTEIRPGNTLYLPIYHEGGLLVLGDVHAFQGDGELYGEGGECAADVTLTIAVDTRYQHPRPLVETGDCLIGLACGHDMFDSIRLVTGDMTRLLSRLHGIREQDAYVLCAMVGSVRFGGSLAREEGFGRYPVIGLSIPKDVR